jgi:hypothetical protein
MSTIRSQRRTAQGLDRYMPVHSARLYGGVVEPARRAAARREIDRLYAWDAFRREGNPRKPDKAHWFTLIRMHDMEGLLQRRHHGCVLPDDDDGRDSLRIVADHIAHLGGEVEAHIIAWAAHWCPWMPQQEAEALAARIAAHPLKYKASTLGWRLRLTEIERTELKITTIRSIDCITDDQIRERRRRLDREYQARHRRLKRAGRPEPVSHKRPWETAGISRATWYRRKAADGMARETKAVGSRVVSIGVDGFCLTHTSALSANDDRGERFGPHLLYPSSVSCA